MSRKRTSDEPTGEMVTFRLRREDTADQLGSRIEQALETNPDLVILRCDPMINLGRQTAVIYRLLQIALNHHDKEFFVTAVSAQLRAKIKKLGFMDFFPDNLTIEKTMEKET